MPLKQMIYVSALSKHQDPSCLDGILKVSSANNQAQQITGILLYINGSFLQVLEGRHDRLEKIYAQICEDPRHQGIVQILYRGIEARQFQEWSMGYPVLSAQELDQMSGRNDFFTAGHAFTELDEGIVRRVLDEFMKGMWRRRIE